MKALLKKKCARKQAIIILLLALILSGSGCYYDKEELIYPGSNTMPDCSIIPAKFSTDIYPLITSKCAVSGCHDATASGGVILQDYNQVSGAKDRINVRALLQKTMPKDAPLSPAEINKIKCWMGTGALNN